MTEVVPQDTPSGASADARRWFRALAVRAGACFSDGWARDAVADAAPGETLYGASKVLGDRYGQASLPEVQARYERIDIAIGVVTVVALPLAAPAPRFPANIVFFLIVFFGVSAAARSLPVYLFCSRKHPRK